MAVAVEDAVEAGGRGHAIADILVALAFEHAGMHRRRCEDVLIGPRQRRGKQ